MSAIVRYDEQHCPIARALDVLGDRWTLLILRELIQGDRRFTDLRDRLPGIAPTLLTQRLRSLADQGLVESKELPPPAARSVYAVTARGRDAVPVIRALARYGMPLLEEPRDGVVVQPSMVYNAALLAYYDPVEATGIDERYLVRIDGEEHLLSSIRGGGEPRDPDVVLDASAATWMDIRQGRTTLRQAIKDERMIRTGPRSATENFRRVFQFA
jgi:DNA-binding HxlR family transcriptional regulator